ncbi:hypothetical protein [Pontibacillus sp. HMF3514]|uniref:hypothetical protein n=1 Tax=Pontibacillus sp. HMF3514 TaxID=2692425 RepID=UPI00131FD4B2|nr:hypothetical protein [Pontibacillus sp. HMF3514]QHE51563.1 hypothetical protein GS400_05725 [Pontibacillus sp. HMF3514]
MKEIYFYLSLGYAGLLFFGIAMFRYMIVFDDTLGQAFCFFGVLLIAAFIRFVERRLGVSIKESNVTKVIFITFFVALTLAFLLMK